MKIRAALGMIGCLVASLSAHAQVQASLVKTEAFFLYSFVKYTQFPSGHATIRVGVVGLSDVTAELQAIARSRAGLALEVNRVNPTDDLSHYDLIFVPATASAQFSRILSRIHKNHTLLIAEDAGLLPQGACIGFMQKNSRLGYKINTKVMGDSHVRMESSIMDLASK